MGRGDGELGEKLAEENKEQGDLILGHHRFIAFDCDVAVADGDVELGDDPQRGVPQPAVQVHSGFPLVTSEVQVGVGFAVLLYKVTNMLKEGTLVSEDRRRHSSFTGPSGRADPQAGKGGGGWGWGEGGDLLLCFCAFLCL